MRALLISVAVLLGVSSFAGAQPYIGSTSPRGGSVEMGGSVIWTGGFDAGDRPATETANGAGSPFTLFTTTSDVMGAAGVDARLGVYLGQRVSVEGSLQYSRPTLQTHIADDFENAPPVTAKATLSSYLIGGSVLYHFGSGTVVPFVSGGAGYLRQLQENAADALTGTEFHGGGGLKVWFGDRRSRFGLRVDAQASSRSKSISFEQKRRIVPTVGFGVSYLF